MKNKNAYLELIKMCSKYKDIGLMIGIDFSRFGMTIKGQWDLPLSRYEIFHKTESFDYESIENYSDDIGIENLIDNFKEKFKKEIEAKYERERKEIEGL